MERTRDYSGSKGELARFLNSPCRDRNWSCHIPYGVTVQGPEPRQRRLALRSGLERETLAHLRRSREFNIEGQGVAWDQNQVPAVVSSDTPS